MKKQNNILKLIKNITYLTLACIAFNACTDEEIYKSSEIVEGVPVEVGFKFTIPSMQKVSTRGLSDEGEFQVNDLYVLIFNANNDQARKTGGGYYNSDLIKNVITGNQANGKVSSGTLTLKTTSGESLIYAVANVKGNDLGGDITAALENVNSLADFKKLSVALTIKANVERSSPALVMSGAYIDGSTQPQTGYCNIPAQSTTLSGKISLTRLDSHIIFKITPNMQANGGKIKTFTPKSWRVYNVPNKSYIVAQDADAVGNTAEDYENTESSIRFGEQTDNIYDFDFYMLENRKNAKTYEGRSIENYKQREEEVKTNEHKNTGEYKYVEPYATFVEIKAHMEIENADNDNGIRVADGTYVIHLGYVDNVAADFKNERNKKYTYNVTINNVEDIVTEVTEEGNPENTPGAEGDIVDSQTTVYNLDAHYGYLILKFKYSEVKDGLQFYVKTPFGETNNDDKSVVGHDCKWLRFARCNNESTLANYPKDGKGLINLFELKADIEDQYQKDTNKDNTYYYTVFVDEYFYENNPLETSSNNNWGNENWEEFVNKDDRYALLIFSPQKSPDGESSYASAKYMITQKSIQTYYSTEKFNSDKTALGMEHIDETGVPNGWESGSYGSSQENGYKNTYPVVNNTNISSYGTETLSNGKNTFTINDAANAIQACMARNRDENNDGKISGSEVKWFLPAINQLVGMFLGAESLPTPLFGDGDKQPGTYTYNKKEIGTYGTYHYISSDKQRLWSEEGATFGPAAGILYAKAPEKLRCVRTLGISSQYNSTSKKEGKIYNMNNSYTFQMAYLDKQSIRTSFIENGELDLHHNFSSYNRPYTAFQVANKRMTIDGIETSNGWGGSNNRPRPTNWESLVKNSGLSRSVCTNYFENANKSDKGSWRAPNQRELMIIYLQDPSLVEYQVTDAYDYRYGSFTRTCWKFNENDHFTVDKDLITKGTVGSFVRCVRDVK